MMGSQAVLEIVRRTGVIAIMRAKSSEQLLQAADAIFEGGICAVEVTLTTPDALELIKQAVLRYKDQGMAFGAGTVLDAESARLAILAGAQFVVSPNFKPGVIALCRRYSTPVFPGVFTPTEIMDAWEAGADMVKVFPASVGGPGFIKALKAPLSQVELVPVGGVNLNNTAEYIRAGATAVGIGAELIDPKLVEAKDWHALTALASRFIQEVKLGRVV
jgi:2-dehydro-3-deoxyphosphogluconate aldolase/(4S)-4-hydroxy-2-oxoglutarate aldolase